MKQSYDVAAEILLFPSRCCDAFQYVFLMLQTLSFYVANVYFWCCNGKSDKKIIGQTDASAGIFGKIAKIILELLSLAQFHPSTIKKFNLMPELYKWVRIYPYAELARHGGLPRQRRVSLGLHLLVKYPSLSEMSILPLDIS